MLKFNHITTPEENPVNLTVERISLKYRVPEWKITDKNGTICRVRPNSEEGSYIICTNDEIQKNFYFPAIVDVVFIGTDIEIYKAYVGNKILLADRDLRRYIDLVKLVSCCFQNGLIKN